MRVPLALENLKQQPTRTSVAVAGVGFALLLIFMQMGFFNSVEQTATQIYGVLDFDLLLTSSQYISLSDADRVTSSRLRLADSDPAIADSTPLAIAFLPWRVISPDEDLHGRQRTLMAIAYDPNQADRIFRVEQLQHPDRLPRDEMLQQLRRVIEPGAVLTDTQSRPQFGNMDIGTETKLVNVPVRVAGRFTLGAGFSSDGMIFISDRTYRDVMGVSPKDVATFGLIRLHPGEDPQAAADRLNARLPADVRVFTRAELIREEQEFWVSGTSVGVIFGIGVIVAIIVGVVFVYQVMAGDISNHLPEYATLKAIGYSNGFLRLVVLQQAVLLALLGYVPGFVASLGLFYVARGQGIPVYMNAILAIEVLMLGLAMCVVSGLLAVRKAQNVDPAELF